MSLSISSPPSQATASSLKGTQEDESYLKKCQYLKLLKERIDSRDVGWWFLFLKYLGGCHHPLS